MMAGGKTKVVPGAVKGEHFADDKAGACKEVTHFATKPGSQCLHADRITSLCGVSQSNTKPLYLLIHFACLRFQK